MVYQELLFLVMVNSERELDEVVASLLALLPGAIRRTPRSLDWEGNWIQVSASDSYDEDNSQDGDEGFLYYRYRVEVSPRSDGATVAGQVSIARRLLEFFRGLGVQAVVCAEFEELLDG
jgi:hypothetical protein